MKGTVINKFRGDVEILRPGLTMLEDMTKVPVLGVIPWMELDLDEEDSLSTCFSKGGRGAALDIAIIHLPRISNFTDFAPLERRSELSVRYVTATQELGRPDLVILPGTKNTMEDLRWLRQRGLEGAIQKLANADTPIIGICGGFQMLGMTLSDPDGVEGGGQLRAMRLLPIDTVFSSEKNRKQIKCKVNKLDGFYRSLNGCELVGYEIHMGESGVTEPFTVQGRVMGTYLHGLFDSDCFTNALIRLLMEDKGLDRSAPDIPMDHHSYKQQQYDLLAETVRDHLDMSQIYRILEQGCREEI